MVQAAQMSIFDPGTATMIGTVRFGCSKTQRAATAMGESTAHCKPVAPARRRWWRLLVVNADQHRRWLVSLRSHVILNYLG
jgi:hypothetical protein